MNKLRVDISDVLLQGCTRQHGQTGLPRLRQAVHLQKISVSPKYEHSPHSCTMLNSVVVAFFSETSCWTACMAFISIYLTDMVRLIYISTG